MDPFYLSLILIAAGLGVLCLELFLPSAGLIGVVAACLLIAGIVYAFIHSLAFGTFVLMGTLFSMPLFVMLMVKVWPLTPIGKAIMLNDERTADEVLPESDFDSLMGQIGVAKTKMLPSGIVEVDGRKLDAVSDGFAIQAGDPVKVISVRENRIHVEPFEGELEDEGSSRAADPSGLSTPLEELGIEDDFLT